MPNDEAPPTEVTEATSSAVPQRGRSSAPLVLYAAVTLSILIAWVLYARLLGTNVLPIDDPYIAMRNAHLLANGEPDTRFPGATPVHGSTSLVHTVLVAGLMKALSPLAAMDVARWLGVLAYALGLARLGLAHTRNVWVAAAGVVAGLLVGQTPHQVLNGLETGLAMAAVAWWLVWASHERPTGCLAVLCGIMPYIRPELAALSTAGLLVLWQQHVGAASPRRVAMMGFGRSVLLALLAAAPWALVYWHYTGAPYTPTAAAKMYYFAEGTHPLAERIIVALLCTGSFLQWHILPLAFAPVFYYVHRAAKLSVAFVAVLPVCLAALWINTLVAVRMGVTPQMHPLLRAVSESPTAWVVAAYLLQAGVLASLSEEFMYRGVLMMSLLRQTGAAPAMALSSAFFAMMHLPAQPQAVLPLFVLGMAMAYVIAEGDSASAIA